MKNPLSFLTKSETPLPSMESPKFWRWVFARISRQGKKLKNRVEALFLEEYEALSKEIGASGLQDPSMVRHVAKTRALAEMLIDDSGKFSDPVLNEAIQFQEKYLYSLGPCREFDTKKDERLLLALNKLRSIPGLKQLIEKISRPWRNPRMEEIIRETLGASPGSLVSDTDARRAALSAYLCSLRQTIGSCFATAPAIVIQDEQPALFFQDLTDIFATGKLKRVVEGKEFIVPFSRSRGSGDWKRPFLFIWNEKKGPWRSPSVVAAFHEAELVGPGGKEELRELFRRVYEEKGSSPHPTTLDRIARVALEAKYGNQALRPLHEGKAYAYESKPAALLKKAQSAFCCYEMNALLRVWEFTLASFSEAKSDVTKWNFFTSLGFRETDPGGIGQVAYEYLKEMLHQTEDSYATLQREYEAAFVGLKYLEGRLKNPGSEQEGKWMKMEYDMKAREFYQLEEMQDDLRGKSETLGRLYAFFIEYLDQALPKYFQEVYDPDIFEGEGVLFEDSPAGFRLMFKHGRENPAAWTFVQSSRDFVEALASFFTSMEVELEGNPQLKGVEKEFSSLITRIVLHVRTDQFLKSAFQRMAASRGLQFPEDQNFDFESSELKPWVYTSGGTMQTLVSCYFRLSEPVKEVSRWIESPDELITFAVDALRSLPKSQLDRYLASPEKSMLMHSPTHAFLLKPFWMKELIEKEGLPYIWLRDKVLFPAMRFWEEKQVQREAQKAILVRLLKEADVGKVESLEAFLPPYASLPTKALREFWVKKPQLKRFSSLVDSLLWEMVPGVKRERFLSALDEIIDDSQLKKEVKASLKEIKKALPFEYNGPEEWISSRQIYETLGAIAACAFPSRVSFPLLQQLKEGARLSGYMPPAPLFFADTNWNHYFFALAVNPGTGSAGLWRFEESALKGAPMTSWEPWLNGDKKDPWVIYMQPSQYLF